MKNTRKLFGMLTLSALTLASCSLEEKDQIFEPGVLFQAATPQEFASLKSDALEDLVQDFQFDASEIGVFTTENGTQISINGACLTNNGNAVTGQVAVEIVELYDRGNMLLTNKTTMGRMNDGGKAIMISGGEFYINATQGGNQLVLGCNMQVIIPVDLTGGADNLMSLWKGTIGEDCDSTIACDDIIWDEIRDEEGNMPGIEIGKGITQGDAYYTFFQEFGWTNVDRFAGDPRPKTGLLVDVPEGFNEENSAVYISYDGEPNALAFLDKYDEDLELFTEHYGQIPIGLEAHVIFVSEDNGNWLYAIKAVTIVADGTISFDLSETATASDAQLKSLINNLP
ncbi:hypothetical protein DHD05_15645 [Arenibacter sp. N53]|uniref:hypothetical protein n=1 Tax=Arenibacter TaxID=178469 RepID=UPI000CD3E4FD|nr:MULTISPECIES: hypothetical protein [Arenibacter]MCM4153023.1 hypothetical protein [Arenibacter sp. N53]